MDCGTIGWELEHPEFAPIALRSASQLAGCDFVFLSTSALEGFWQRASGDDVRQFRSPRSERAAWRAVAALVRQLRRLLRRGGRLACRLDRIGTRCRVQHSPGPACFPSDQLIDAYRILARVHPALEYWQRMLQPACGTTLSLVGQEHPFRSYLREFRAALRPQVAVAQVHAHALPLAVTSDDEVVACATSQVVLLPPTESADPRLEAEHLRRAARVLLGDAADTAWPATNGLPGIGHLRQRELVLERQLTKLQAKRERLRREIERRQLLAQLIEYSDPAQLAAAAGEAFRELGIDVPGFRLVGPALEVVVERVQADGQPTYLLSGQMGGGHHATQPPQLTVLASGVQRPPARSAGALIPAEQLFQAVAAVFRERQNKSLRRRVAADITSCQGIYAFDPGVLTRQPG